MTLVVIIMVKNYNVKIFGTVHKNDNIKIVLISRNYTFYDYHQCFEKYFS